MRIELFWRSGSTPYGELVGGLLKEVRGLPSLTSIPPVGWQDWGGVAFEDMYWSRAHKYLDMMREWLWEHGASKTHVQIDGWFLEKYLEEVMKERDQLKTAASTAVHELRGSRFSIPSPRIKAARVALENAIARLKL